MFTKIQTACAAIVAVSTLLILPACVSTTLDTPSNHSANPKATTAPLAPALPLGSSATPTPAATSAPGGHQHGKHAETTEADTAPAAATAPAHGAGH